ncbi:LIM and calponin homology domains-containing protein 1-like [Triplophysa rosa]|uniref:LIM and calponin homology domains-containing protein 1-like n=1 Tax=Triplophysa rosa TaxID=992332 RepID=UPI002545DBE8|nr:LIM and calponin homology domains-containing protein 1-like [Triplophysa rosa]
MASPGLDAGRRIAVQPRHHHAEPATEPAVLEVQRWIEAVTGRSFGEKDFRAGLDNGILLCELLSSIRPGLVKKINRLPTPVAALVRTFLHRSIMSHAHLTCLRICDFVSLFFGVPSWIP